MSEYLKWYKSHCGHSKIKQQAKKEIEQLREQLENANERVEELGGFYATYEREFKAVAKWAISMQNDICEGKYHNNTPEGMIYSESAWVDCRWQDVTDPLFTTHEEALNKFALEQKVIGYYDSCIESGMNGGQSSLLADIYAEQLRKGQEK